jgi:dTMP kinase
VVELREPGGTPAGERIRAIVLAAPGGDPVGARCEALLFAASRAQAVEQVIAPALARGAHVVVDRFVDSSLIYQGAVRGLGIEAVRAVNAFALDGLLPDRTVLLELAPAQARERQAGQDKDRIEAEPETFHDRVAAAYEALLATGGERYVRVNAEGDPETVAARVREALDGA